LNTSIYLTKRDSKLLADLHTYGILRTHHIAEKFFKGVAVSTVLRRLRILEEWKLIGRVTGLENGALAWKLEPKGVSMVSDRPPKRIFRPANLNHDLILVDLRLALERENIAGGWEPEHEIRRQVAQAHGINGLQDRAIPDGLAAVRYKGVMYPIAIELELNYKVRARYGRIFRRYREKKKLLAVWYLVKDLAMGRSLARSWNYHLREDCYTQFIWSVASDVIANPKTAEIHLPKSVHAVGDFFGPADINL
jgi:hypothetical protein